MTATPDERERCRLALAEAQAAFERHQVLLYLDHPLVLVRDRKGGGVHLVDVAVDGELGNPCDPARLS